MAVSKYTTLARHYAEAVVAGDLPACRWVQLACQRQLNDLARFKSKGSPYVMSGVKSPPRSSRRQVMPNWLNSQRCTVFKFRTVTTGTTFSQSPSALQRAMRGVEKANPDTLYGVFGNAQWSNKEQLSDALLKDLIEHFSRISFGNKNAASDVLGDAYEYKSPKRFLEDWLNGQPPKKLVA